MLLAYYTISFILFILIASTTQLIVIPYLTRLKNGHKCAEYKGNLYRDFQEMIKRILTEKFSEGIESICLYNAGFKSGRQILKIYSPKCKSLLKYRYPHYGSIDYDVISPNSLRQNVYYCGNDVTYNFKAIVDYALKKNCFIEFKPHRFRPTPPPLQFCIYTLYGRLCLMRTSQPSYYWQRLWSGCDKECFYSNNFTNVRLKYLIDFNYHRKLLRMKTLCLSSKLGLSATARAREMARRKTLLRNSSKAETELAFYAPNGYGIYVPRITFESLFDKNGISKKVLSHKKILSVLFNGNYEYIGFGFAKRGNGAYICIKLSKSLEE